MGAKNWLFLISIAGALVAVGGAIWGHIKENATAPEAERKPLTRATQVSIAFAIGGALIAIAGLGLGHLISRQDAESAARAKADEQSAAERRRADDRRWTKLNADQLALRQTILSDLQRREAREQAEAIRASQRLFAAVEERRDRDTAETNLQYQTSQSRRIAQTQPLTSLHVQLTFAGFSNAEIGSLVRGQEWVAGYPDRDDDYPGGGDIRVVMDNANMFANVLAPLIEMSSGAPADTDARQTGDLSLVLDLNGDGSWLLPLGTTGQPGARGLFVNRNWLNGMGAPYGERFTEGVTQNFGDCSLPVIGIDPQARTVTVTLVILPACLPVAVHRAQSAQPIARLSDQPRIAIFRGPSPFPGEATNIARAPQARAAACWTRSAGQAGGRSISLVAVPNGNPEIGIRAVLTQRRDQEVTTDWNRYDAPEAVGACSLFH